MVVSRRRVAALTLALLCASLPAHAVTFLAAGGVTEDALQRLTTPPDLIVDTGALDTSAAARAMAGATATIAGQTVPRYVLPSIADAASGVAAGAPRGSASQRAYLSFNMGGCHFVLLDTTLPMTRLGHVAQDELKWLDADLKRTRRGTPIFVFCQHPIGGTKRIVDNEDDLLQTLALHDVQAILFSTHQPETWVANDIRCIGAPPLAAGWCVRVQVDPSSVAIDRVPVGGSTRAPEHIATEPRAGAPEHALAFAWDDPDVPLLARRRFLAELRDATGHAGDEKSRADYRLDGGPLVPMHRDERDKQSVSFVAELLTKGLTPGAHVLTIQLTSGSGGAYTREEPFLVERLSGQSVQTWNDPFGAGAAIEAGPVLAGGMLVVANRGGRVYGIDPVKGLRRWGATMPAPVCATPVAAGGDAIVAAQNGAVWALDGRSGRVRWRADLGGPILASPAISANTVACVAGGVLVGLDAATGARRWTAGTPSLVPAQPAAGNGAFFVLSGVPAGVVAVDAATGAARWKSTAAAVTATGPFPAPAFGDHRVVVACADGLLRALDAASGDLAWVSRAPDGGSFANHAPTCASDRVYAVEQGPSGVVCAIDASSGHVVWHTSVGAALQPAAPTTDGPRVVLATVAGGLLCLDAASGGQICRYALDPGWVLGAPALGPATIYAGSLNGRAYAVSIPSAAPARP